MTTAVLVRRGASAARRRLAATPLGRLKPTNNTQAEIDQTTRDFWAAWKTQNLQQVAAQNWYVVKATGANVPYVGEGQGYGMLAAAQMAPADTNARNIFDGILRYVLDHPSSINPNLHAAEQNASFVSVEGGDCATDADMDIAYALLVADNRWGSAGTFNYKQLAITRINAIKASLVSPTTGLLRLGDWSSGSWDAISRSSDWMTGHMAAFAAATGDTSWTTRRDAHLTATERLQTNYAPSTGLLPDFTTGGASVQPAPANTLESADDGRYSWNACRTPWRLGAADDARSKAAALKISRWAAVKTVKDPNAFDSGYTLAGVTITGAGANEMAFTSPLAVAATLDTDQEWLNALWTYLRTRTVNDYYGASITLLCMIIVGQTYWVTPNAGVGGAALTPNATLSRYTYVATESGETQEFGYYSHDGALSASHAAVQRLMFVIHGDNRDAQPYGSYGVESVNLSGQHPNTKVVAPHFIADPDITSADTHLMYWSDGGWKEGSRAQTSPYPRTWRPSSFEVLDRLIAQAVGSYPNLTNVVIIGHSAGGQFVNRYASATAVPDTYSGIQFHFLPANPSSYLYMDNRRWKGASFGTLTSGEISACPGYDDYKYGLASGLNAYMTAVGVATIRTRYASRKVTYLLGSGDTTTAGGLDVTCEGNWQGAQRYERGNRYWDYLAVYYGTRPASHARVQIPVDHDGQAMITHSASRAVMFP